MAQKEDLLDYLSRVKKNTSIFTVRWLYPSGRCKPARHETVCKRKSFSTWLSHKIAKGPYKIGEFEIRVHNRTNPIKYIATRVK